ncbi:MAG: MoaD family protein [Dehalococcoidia bacterium]|jgi:MoaD family protein|nr:MoaD family protein [Dehalococcoidia bacterium]
MAVEVRVPSLLRGLVGGVKSIQTSGPTIGLALDDIEARFPGFKERVIDPNGAIKQFVSIFINGEDVRYIQSLDTPLLDGDQVSILPAVAGG